MPVEWNAHRFSGGALALCAANSVVHRGDPDRVFDRFDDAAELPRFAAAASRFCAEELDGATIAVDAPQADRAGVIALRETIDRLFRSHAGGGSPTGDALAPLLHAGGRALAGFDAPVRGGAARLPLAVAMTVSALALIAPAQMARIKICPNCRWLFVDRSRNATRLWCDMKVCGNRAKAQRHYRRRRETVETEIAR